jgi:hypothetical protein
LAPEQPLALASPRAQEQSRNRARALLLLRSSLQPQDQSSPQLLPLAPHQRPLLARLLSPDQALAVASLKPSVRPPPQPQDKPHPLYPLLTLAQAPPLLRHLEQLLLQPPFRAAQSAVKTLQLGKAVSCRLKAVSSLAPLSQPPQQHLLQPLQQRSLQPLQQANQQQPLQPSLRHLHQQNLQRSFPPRLPSAARSLTFWLLPFDL